MSELGDGEWHQGGSWVWGLGAWAHRALQLSGKRLGERPGLGDTALVFGACRVGCRVAAQSATESAACRSDWRGVGRLAATEAHSWGAGVPHACRRGPLRPGSVLPVSGEDRGLGHKPTHLLVEGTGSLARSCHVVRCMGPRPELRTGLSKLLAVAVGGWEENSKERGGGGGAASMQNGFLPRVLLCRGTVGWAGS